MLGSLTNLAIPNVANLKINTGFLKARIPPIITAVINPFISPLEDGDTIGPALSANYDQTSNYTSSEGTIVSAVATLTVNGASATTSTEVTFEDVVLLEVLVTDSEGNTRTFRAGRVVPADVQTDLWTLILLPDGTLVATGATFTLNDTILEVA